MESTYYMKFKIENTLTIVTGWFFLELKGLVRMHVVKEEGSDIRGLQ